MLMATKRERHTSVILLRPADVGELCPEDADAPFFVHVELFGETFALSA